MNIVAIIPARGGSKGLPRKNIKIFNGKPLIFWTIDAAIKSKFIDKVIVSTDDVEIAQISLSFGAEVPGLRPLDLSKDDTPTLPVIQFVLRKLFHDQNYIPDLIVLLQATSPLRSNFIIDEAIQCFLNSPAADSLVSCVKIPHNYNPESLMFLNEYNFLEYVTDSNNIKFSRQEKNTYIARNGAAIYITTPKIINDGILGGNILPYFMKSSDSIDIDTEDDFLIAEAVSMYKNNG